MNADKLFDLIGKTPDDCLEDEIVPIKTLGRPKKPMLIAAIIVLILALAGCTALAVSLLNVESVTMGTYQLYGLPEDNIFMSLAGADDSPEYEAAREWMEFISVYDPDYEILFSYSSVYEDLDDLPRPEGLDHYNCYTDEMAYKVYEIAEKYDLNLMGTPHTTGELPTTDEPMNYFQGEDFMYEFLELYGIGNYITVPEDMYSFQSLQYYYDDGTFYGGGDVMFTEEDPLWTYQIGYSYYCAVKGSFNLIRRNISDFVENGYEEWTHTVPDGTEVTIVTSGERAIILADTEDYFVTIAFDIAHYSYIKEETLIMSREVIEDFTDLFNFTYEITPPQ